MITLLGPRDDDGRPAWKVVPETRSRYGLVWSAWSWSPAEGWYRHVGSSPDQGEALAMARAERVWSPYGGEHVA